MEHISQSPKQQWGTENKEGATTQQTTTFALNKLIRDKLLQDSLDEGIQVAFSKLQWREYKHALTEKLQEEIQELLQTTEKEKQVEELIDVQELLDALRKRHHYMKSSFLRDLSTVSENYTIFSLDDLFLLLEGKIRLLNVFIKNLTSQDKEYKNIDELLLALQKIIYTILEKTGVSKIEFERQQLQKREKKWWFDEWIYVQREKVPVDHWLHDYYMQQPEKHPHI